MLQITEAQQRLNEKAADAAEQQAALTAAQGSVQRLQHDLLDDVCMYVDKLGRIRKEFDNSRSSSNNLRALKNTHNNYISRRIFRTMFTRKYGY